MKNNFYKSAYILSLILLITAIFYLIAWFIRPSEFLNMGIGIPHAIMALIFFVIIPTLLVIGGIRSKFVNKHFKFALTIYFLNIGVYFFVAFYAHAISVSEICLINGCSSKITNLQITCPDEKIFIESIEKGEQLKLPLIPNKEGNLRINGKISNKSFEYNTTIFEIQATKFVFEVISPKNIKYKEEYISWSCFKCVV